MKLPYYGTHIWLEKETSSYCGTSGRLRLADPQDLLIVCGEWNIGLEPELHSPEKEVVLTVIKIINHESYETSSDPGLGSDIAVYHVDDTPLRENGIIHPERIYPACLPIRGNISPGTIGIFPSWKDPVPLYVYYSAALDERVQDRPVVKYKLDELILRHTRMDIVICKDPAWMNSNTFYPPGVLCARDPSGESCFDAGDSGSGLVVPSSINKTRYVWTGLLSFYRGCDRGFSSGDPVNQINFFNGENPGVFTNGACFLNWIANQYSMTAPEPDADCYVSMGDESDKDATQCRTDRGYLCDFKSEFPITDFFMDLALIFASEGEDIRDLRFTKCELRTIEGYVQMVFQCPINSTHLGVCPNNCRGVDPSAIVAGGSALVATAGLATMGFLQAFGLGALGLGAAGTVAIGTCTGPLLCQVGDQCCRIVYGGPNVGYICPPSC